MKQLYTALLAAQREAQDAPLDGTNQHHDYHYTRAPTMYTLGKRILNKHGLMLLPEDLVVYRHGSSVRAPASRKGEPAETLKLTAYDVCRQFTLAHESGQSKTFKVQWPIYLQGGKRPRDKAVAATDTTIMAYVYRDILAIGRMQEGEVDDRQEDSAEGRARPETRAARLAGGRGGEAEARVASQPARGAVDEAKGNGAAGKGIGTTYGPGSPGSPGSPGYRREAPAPSARGDDKVASGDQRANMIADTILRSLNKHESGKSVGLSFTESTADLTERTPAEAERDVAAALMLGVTPQAPGSAPHDLIPLLPTDPSADDLEAAGWDRDVALQLTTLEQAPPVPRATVNSLTRLAAKVLGLKPQAAKRVLGTVFESVGVDVAERQTPNGYQLRLWAVKVLQVKPELVS